MQQLQCFGVCYRCKRGKRKWLRQHRSSASSMQPPIIVLFFLTFLVSSTFTTAWQPLTRISSTKPTSFSACQRSILFAIKKQSPTITKAKPTTKDSGRQDQYSIRYSPNFQRHIVSRISTYKNGTRIPKTVVKSFIWLDQAQKAYPAAVLEPMDLPPHSPLQDNEAASTLAKTIAGAGLEETTVYYQNQDNDKDSTVASRAAKPNNGASYLLKFLQKLYSALPTITPAVIHRGVMDKFPKLAFYDPALVHERLFFLLAPLPPDDILRRIKAKSTVSYQSKKATRDAAQESDNIADYFDDFPVLFHKYGYGAGLTSNQLVQAFQSLPQFWLPIYFGDASVDCKRPQDILPYVFYHLSSHPEALRDTNVELDPLLNGVIQADVASVAHAKSALGLSWDQCRLLLLALPTLRTCDIEPNWELYQRGPVKSMLIEESLIYLRLRLQLDPLHIFALIKTHTRMSNYRFLDRLKPSLDALQKELHLDSEEVQRIILRMPSLLGIATSSLSAHLQFFTEEVGLTPQELKAAVSKLPALLQYSLPNLKSKLSFFSEELNIPAASVVKMTVSQPTLWAVSLESNLRPKAEALASACDLTMRDTGGIIARVPELLLLNWRSNLEPTLSFLASRLDLTPSQLSSLVKSTPRVLVHSIHNSLEYKIALIEDHERNNGKGSQSIRDIILHRPGLLLTGKSALIKRLERSKQGLGMTRVLAKISTNGTVIGEFSSVQEAAKDAGKSTSFMYKAIREGKIIDDATYVHGKESLGVPKATKRPRTKDPDAIEQDLLMEKGDKALVVYVSGRVYPPDNVSQNRGLRRAGGMAIAIPSLPGGIPEGFFDSALDECCRGQILSAKHITVGQRESLLVQLGYAYLRPSRRRASLYVCLVTLRIFTGVYLLAANAAAKAREKESKMLDDVPPSPPNQIHIVTDSNYVYELLHNAADILEWGSNPTVAEFRKTRSGSNYAANPDIVYTISRTYSRLVELMGGTTGALQGNLTSVRFGHIIDAKNPLAASAFRENMGEWAKEAAEKQYQRTFIREKAS